MMRSLGSWRCRYWLVLPLDPEFRFDAPRPDPLLARQQVAGLASDTFNLHAMRSFLIEAFRLDVHRMDDRQVVDTLAELLAHGRFQLVEEELPRSPATAWDFPAKAPTAPQAQRSRRVAASGHPEPHVRIVDVQDARGRSVKGGGRPYDPKRAGVRGSKKTRLVVRLEQQEADLQLQILPPSGNEVARAYYRGGVVRDFWLRGATPGEHTFEWDGRGVVDGERYILQGEYTVQLNAACARCRALAQDRTTIEVARPRAYLYEPKDIRWVAHYLKTGLGQLSDGTGFDTATDVDADAHQALAKMPDAAIWVFSGHGTIAGPLFEHVSKPGTYLVGEVPEGGGNRCTRWSTSCRATRWRTCFWC